MSGPAGRFDTNLYLLESPSGAETIFEIGVRVGASEKVTGASEGFAIQGSIADRCSEKHKEDIKKWEGG
jgi:hypothetical protein